MDRGQPSFVLLFELKNRFDVLRDGPAIKLRCRAHGWLPRPSR